MYVALQYSKCAKYKILKQASVLEVVAQITIRLDDTKHILVLPYSCKYHSKPSIGNAV